MIAVMVAFGIIIPIMPFYIEQFGAGGTEMGLMFAVFSLMQFICAPFWGSLSDRYGRRRIMMVGVLGNALSLLVMGLANSFWLLLAARAVGGILSSATLPTIMAYIGDSTEENDRGGGMGLIGAAMGLGMILGPGIGGWLSGESLSTPFFVASALSLLSLLMIWIILPESLPEEKRIKDQRAMRGPQLGVLWQALVGPLGFLMFLSFLVNFALANFEGIFGLYADLRYDYGPEQVGTVMMVTGIVSTIVQLFLTGPATRRLGEANVIRLSLAGSALGFLLMAVVRLDSLVLLSVGFFVFANAMLRPSIMSLTSKLTTDGQGVALGLNNSFQSLGRVVGPLYAGIALDYNINMPYLSAAVIMLGTFIYAVLKVPPTREATAPAVVPVQYTEE